MTTASSSDDAAAAPASPWIGEASARAARARDDRVLARGQHALRALCFVAVPMLLTAIAVRWLDPFGPRWVASVDGVPSPLAMRLPALFVVGLFFFFFALARYWAPRLPYGGYLSAVPARFVAGASPRCLRERARAVELQATLRHVRIQRRLEARVAAPEREEIERLLRDLWDGLESQDDEALGAAAARLRMSAAAALAEQARADTLRVAVVAGLAGLVAVLLRAEVASAYTVLGVSMLPSLAPGDVIVGDAWTYHGGRAPRRGDLVVFHSSAVAVADPATPPVLVKRVIGLPGDRVRMEGGVPVINGWRVPTCDAGEYVHVARDGSGRAIFGRVLLEFLEDRVYLTLHTGLAKPFEPYRVEPGTVFVLGDSRTESADSRAWNGGRGGGVPLPALVARGGWFVSGVALDGGTDWKRVLRSLDGLALLPRTDEFDASALRDGIAKCLRERPPQTSPPALAAEQSQ